MNLTELSETRQKRIKAAVNNMRFGELVQMQLDAVAPGTAWMTLPVRDEVKQVDGVVHGGAVATLIDSAAAFAVISVLNDDELATTVDLTVSYLRPLLNGSAKAVASVRRGGARMIFLSVDVFDDSGNLAATGLTTYLRLPKR